MSPVDTREMGSVLPAVFGEIRRRARSRHAVVAALTVISAGCTDRPERERVSGEPASTTTYSGDAFERIQELRLYRDWTTLPDASLSSSEFLGGVVVGVNGNVFVLDLGLSVVLVFDSTGRRVRTIGRKGPGPGEFSNPRTLAISGDTLLVLEYARSLEFFSTDGKHLRSTQGMLDGSLLRGIERIVHTRDGIALIERRGSVRVQDTVAVRFLQNDGWRTGVTVISLARPRNHVVGRSVVSRPLFAPMPQIVVSPAGSVYSTRGETFTIDVRSSAGELLERIVAQIPRLRVSDEDVDAIMTRRQQANPDRDYGRLPVSEYRPAIGRMLVDRDDRLLVERIDRLAYPDGELPDSSEWIMIAPDRRIQGRLTMSRTFTPHAFDRCGIVGIQLGEFDVPAVVRFRIASAEDPERDLCPAEAAMRSRRRERQ